jgi:hypothetical protein
MTITETRKNDLATRFGGDAQCINKGSLLDAITKDVTDEFILYTDDVIFLKDNIDWCAGDGEKIVDVTLVLDASNTNVPQTWKTGTSEYVKATLKNTGDVKWKGYMGVRLTDKNGVEYEYNGDESYAKTIAAGSSSPLYATVMPAASLSDGIMQVMLILHNTLTGTRMEIAVPTSLTSAGEVTLVADSTTIPENWNSGGTNYVHADFVNNTESSFKGYLGLILINSAGNSWEYAGTSTYAKTIAAGETAALNAIFTLPADMGTDIVEATLVVHNSLTEESDHISVPLSLTAPGELELTTTEPTYAALWETGKSYLISAEFNNIGAGAWKGYMGAKLTDENGTSWEYSGNSAYAKTIKSGATGTLSAVFTVPTSLKAGIMQLTLMLHGKTDIKAIALEEKQLSSMELDEDNTTYPTTWISGKTNYVTAWFENTGGSDFNGYMGVILEDDDGTKWEYVGNETYKKTISEGETGYLKSVVELPASVMTGEKNVTLVLHEGTRRTEIPLERKHEALEGIIVRTETTPTVPTTWTAGTAQTIGAEYRNDGESSWRGYMGVKLTDKNGTQWEYAGSATYTYTVAAGASRTLWVRVTPPTSMASGPMTVEFVPHTV